MRLTRTLLMVLVLGIVTFAPTVALAADATFFGPIIPKECHCPDSAPDWGCVVQTIQNGINFAVTLGIIIFTLVIAYAGAMYMASGANPGQHKAAVKMIQNVLLGLLVMLSAWVMVDFVMGVLYDSERTGFGPWEAILADGDDRMCLEVNQNQPQAPGTGEQTDEQRFNATMAALAACNIPVPADSDRQCVRDNTQTNGDVNVCFELDETQTQCLARELAGEEPEGPVACATPVTQISVSVGANAVVSAAAVNVLKEILSDACLTSATITSGRRTSADQARIMYDNIVRQGVEAQKRLYGQYGDQVIDVYVAQRNAGASATQTRSAMQQKIDQLGCSNVSNHCSTQDVFDVAPSSIGNRSAFEQAIRDSSAVTHYIFPPQDPAYHIEL